MPPVVVVEKLRWDSLLKCFKRGEKRLKGLLPALQRRFYPHYSFTQAKYNRGLQNESEYAQRKQRRSEVATDSQGAAKRKRGFATGIKIDKEIVATVRMFKKNPAWDCAVFFNREARERTGDGMSPEDRVTCSTLTLQTQRFWERCRSKALLPYATQKPLEYTQLDIAHPLDVLCLDADGGIWIVEVKTGYEGYLDACTDKRMEAPLHNQTDSAANQHQVQLAVQRELFIKTYPKKTLAGEFILHLTESAAVDYTRRHRLGGAAERSACNSAVKVHTYNTLCCISKGS